MRHDQPGQHRAAPPRPTLADQLERMTARFDVLTQRARLGAPYDDLEEEGQAIASDLRALFRGRRARLTNPPLHISADGLKGKW